METASIRTRANRSHSPETLVTLSNLANNRLNLRGEPPTNNLPKRLAAMRLFRWFFNSRLADTHRKICFALRALFFRLFGSSLEDAGLGPVVVAGCRER